MNTISSDITTIHSMETLSMGACVKARLPDDPEQQKDKPKINGQLW